MLAPRRVRRPVPLKLRSSWPSDMLQAGESPRALNVRMRFGEVRPAPGRNILAGESGSEKVLGLFKSTFQNGETWAVRLMQTKIHRWGQSSPASPRQFHAMTGPAITNSTRRWTATASEGRFFFSRGIDQIMRWPAGSGGPSAATYEIIPASAGTVPKAKFIEYLGDRLVAARTTEGGTEFAQRVRWPKSGDHTYWDDTTGLGAGFLDLFEEGEEEITMFRALGSEGVVYRPSYISHLVPTGQILPAFVEEGRIRGIGTEAGYTVASNGRAHFFMGQDGKVYSWDGSSIQDIGMDVEEEIKALVDPDLLSTYFGAVLPSLNEYWLVIGSSVFVYDYLRNSWSRDSYASLTALMEFKDIQSVTSWASAPGTWATATGSWEDYFATGKLKIWGGRQNGGVQLIDDSIVYDYWSQGSIVDRLIESDDMYIGFADDGTPDPMRNGIIKRLLLIYKYVNSEPFEVGVSVDQGQTWKTKTIVPNARGFSYVDVTDTVPASNIARYRLRENNANGQFRWRHVTIELEDAGDFNPAQLA